MNKKKQNQSQKKTLDKSNSKSDVELVVEKKLLEAIPVLTKQLTVSLKSESFFSGPLPPPEMAERFEKLQSGFVDRSLTMAEKEQDRHYKVLTLQTHYEGLSKLISPMLGFIMIICALGSGVFLIANDYPVGGFVTLLSALAAVVAAYFKDKKSESKTPENKKKI